jgi:type II secretory pathway pseudopilin PulG
MSMQIHFSHTKGSILILTVVFMGIFVSVSAALLTYLTSSLRSERVAVASAQALALAEGAIDAAASAINTNPSYTGETNTAVGPGTFTITVTSIDSSTKRVTATAYVPNSSSPTATKTVKATIALSTDNISFHYGIQAGTGGFTLSNSSSITGNVFAGGPVIGGGSNYVYGDVISSGASGLVYGVHATSSVYAHTIGNAGTPTTIDKDAYYVTKTNTTVSGTLHPGSTDQPTADLPIPDSQIAEWESEAVAGGTISSCDGSGNYTITTNVTIGPIKIACNLVIKSSSAIVTVAGPIWVTGNFTTQTGPTVKMAASLGSENVAIIADNPSNRSGSGIITVGQSTIFQGSGASNSFVFLISQNNSAEQGGATVAVSMSQGASALVAYAAHGLLTLSQSVSVKEATGYKIALSQSANVVYDTGLPSTVFQSGPGGSWAVATGTYAITR